MGDFSRSTFDQLKHYVGVRMQQGVPLLDADWNELEDIRRFEVQAFLKWFVGDGVPAGNDGFRIAALPGGGIGTIVLTAAAAGPGPSSLDVDVSSANPMGTEIGFGPAHHRATRALAPAQLTGAAVGPFVLSVDLHTSDTLAVTVNGTQRIASAGPNTFESPAVNASDLVAFLNQAMPSVVASVGVGDNFLITGGDGTGPGAGRCLVDGRDAVLEGSLAYTDQPLYNNSALAAAWAVPVVAPLSAPSTGTRNDLVYLDVWDREVTSAEDDNLVNPAVGVETAVRLRREWTVRVRPGLSQVPVAGDSDFTAGHSYLALATLVRHAATPAILAADLTDLRGRNLQLAPATLIQDVLGTASDDYRRGVNRPVTNVREAVNAVLAGRVPASTELSVSPGTGTSALGHASVVDASGRLVIIWQATRSTNNEQAMTAVLQPADPDPTFRVAQATSGDRHRIPAAVALPGGDIVLVYNNFGLDNSKAAILMKRAAVDGLPGATERVAFDTANVADQQARAVLVDDQVVIFSQQGSGTETWSYFRYRHTTDTFVDTAPIVLSPALSVQDLHAAAAGGVAWVAYQASNTTITALRLDPAHAPAGQPSQGTVDQQQTFTLATSNSADVFVLAGSNAEAMVFYDNGDGLVFVENLNAAWSSVNRIPQTDASDGQPTAVRDSTGTVYLAYQRQRSSTVADIILRRFFNGLWSAPQVLVADGSFNARPNLLLVPGLGLWLAWVSNRKTEFDVYAKHVITFI